MNFIEAYDAAERAAMAHLGNRQIQASTPSIFVSTGYPLRVQCSDELWRYADVMHDQRARMYFDALGGLTEQEFSLWTLATKHAVKTTVHLGRRLVPRNAPLAAIAAYRMIKSVCPMGRIFEIGPGSGYLGAMLAADGYEYRATEVTQAFCLWLHKYWGHQPLPWWQWIDYKRPDFPVEVITVNHALNEMSLEALRYLIVRAERMLGHKGVLVAQNTGWNLSRQKEDTLEYFAQRNWKVCGKAYQDDFILVPPEVPLPLPVPSVLGERTKTWADVEAVWRELEAEPSPDDEFYDYLDGKIKSG